MLPEGILNRFRCFLEPVNVPDHNGGEGTCLEADVSWAWGKGLPATPDSNANATIEDKQKEKQEQKENATKTSPHKKTPQDLQ